MRRSLALMKLLGWLFALPAACSLSTAGAAELNESTFEQWRDRILPGAEEMSYSKIAWRTSFWEAVIEAQEREKPILLWTMNGHPLGCT